MIHRIVLMKCFGCSRDDLYLFDFEEDVLNGNMSNEGLKILQQTAEKAEKCKAAVSKRVFVILPLHTNVNKPGIVSFHFFERSK